MKLKRTIKISFRQLLINCSKSIFAMVDLSIGIASVITMVAIGNGAKEEAISQLEKTGTNLIVVNAGKVKKVMERRQKTDLVTTLRIKDYEALLNSCPSVKEAVPSLDGMVKVKYGNTTTKCMINGITNPYFQVKNFEMDKGYTFSSIDEKIGQRVTVLGGQISRTLFGSDDPNGLGIPEDKLPLVFEPFYRTDQSRSRKTGGYGLGLHLCKRIMDLHGAGINLKNKQEGTGIIVTLNFRS